MFKNYLLITLRNFWRNKVFSVINISGLAIGICASLIIYLIVQYEFSFEDFRKDKENIYRVVNESEFQGQVSHFSGVPNPLPQAARQELPSVDALTHCLLANEMIVSVPRPDVRFKKQEKIVFTDDYYFYIFPTEWLAGSLQSALLNEPNKVVLSESRAGLYFSGLPPAQILGKEIIYDDSVRVTVSGIVKDLPGPTDLLFHEFISLPTTSNSGFKNNYKGHGWSGVSSDSQLFVKLNSQANTGKVEKELLAIIQKHSAPSEGSGKSKLRLQPIADLHFDPLNDKMHESGAHKPTLYGLITVALFLLVLACINFINLTTAQSLQRAREIGVRKTLGGTRTQLAFQFFTETFILTLVATVIAIIITPPVLELFKEFIRPEISASVLKQFNVICFLLLLVVIVTAMAGFYPALLLSRFKPVSVLKNQIFISLDNQGKKWLRKSLTITQFVVALFFITGTLAVSRQISFSLNKDLGFKKDGIVFFDTRTTGRAGGDIQKATLLMNKLKAIPEIKNVSLSAYSPASNNGTFLMLTYKDSLTKIENIVELKFADTTYFSIYKLKLLAGRYLHQSDSGGEYLINDTYRKELGFKTPEAALGKMIDNVPIVGILADFHARSTHSKIGPLAYICNKHNRNTIHVLFHNGEEQRSKGWSSALTRIEKAYADIYPGSEFSYEFFDESVAAFYKTEKQTLTLLEWATGLCIFISCLGLWGLVIYTTNRRTKEIGIRKVFGATVKQIIFLLSKDFIVLIIVAFLIAVPLAAIAIHKWLLNFEYKAEIGVGVYLTSVIGLTVVAALILSLRIFKVSISNPVKSLRTE